MTVIRGFGGAATGSGTHYTIYGTGRDGAITRSSNMTETSGVKMCTTYEVETGTTVTLPNSAPLVIYATERVTIDGTIEGTGRGGDGGRGGTGTGRLTTNPRYGVDGEDGYAPIGRKGGDGGRGGEDSEGPGTNRGGTGGSCPLTDPELSEFETKYVLEPGHPWADVLNGTAVLGHGGAGGGGGRTPNNLVDAGDGGDGGDGGGGMIILAPVVELRGTFNLNGTDGGDGGNGGNRSGEGAGGGGGGGGGSGGAVHVVADSVIDTAVWNQSGGAAGLGGNGSTGGTDGVDGQPGEDGVNIFITP